LVLSQRTNVQALSEFRRGFFEIQDEGSQLIAEVVAPGAGPIVDFCAGAGGKTLALADLLAPQVPLIALDTRSHGLQALQRRAQRATRCHITTHTLPRDGSLPEPVRRWRGQAARVLVDAPCTGTGVLRRHPETRLRLDAALLSTLPEQQSAILARASTLVAPGGRLIYATCSVLPAENNEVVQRFLQNQDDFTLLPLAEVLGEPRALELGDGRVLQVAPHTHGTDGFYAAVLQRQMR